MISGGVFRDNSASLFMATVPAALFVITVYNRRAKPPQNFSLSQRWENYQLTVQAVNDRTMWKDTENVKR